MGIEFVYYARLVKNLRGVLIVDPSNRGSIEAVKTLSRMFRYRFLGIPPAAAGRLKLPSRVFRELFYPLPIYNDFVEELVTRGFERIIAEPLVLSSLYITPAFNTVADYNGILESNSIMAIHTCKGLSRSDWKLHMRIADYTILDYYEDMVDIALKLLRGELSLSDAFEERKGIVERDARRYWRIDCNRGKIFLYYVEPLLLFKSMLMESRVNLSEELAAAFSVIPVVNLALLEE